MPSSPPSSNAVAGRALMVAALMERARLETANSPSRAEALSQWVAAHALTQHLGAQGRELFDAPLGSWTEEDLEAVGWTTEELQLLLWALARVDFPALEVPADGPALLVKVPLLGDGKSFIERAHALDPEALEEKRALYEVLNEAIRSEVYARSLQEDPAALEDDEDLEHLLRSVAAEGFDRAAVAAQGKVHEAVGGLRFWARTLLDEFAAPELDAKKLVAFDDAALANVLGLANARAEGLAWLLEGDEDAEQTDE